NGVKSDSNVSDSTGGNGGAGSVASAPAAGGAGSAGGTASEGCALFASCAAASFRADQRRSVSGSCDFSSSAIGVAPVYLNDSANGSFRLTLRRGSGL